MRSDFSLNNTVVLDVLLGPVGSKYDQHQQ